MGMDPRQFANLLPAPSPTDSPPGWQSCVLPMPPGVNHLTSVVRGRKIKSKEGRAYKNDAAILARAAGIREISGDVEVRVVFWFPSRRADVDGPCKALLDCLSGIAYHDDKQVRSFSVLKECDPENPRAEVQVGPFVRLSPTP